MRKILLSIFLSAATMPAMGLAIAGEPITLRDMGSFHVGGRVVEISGKPVKELVLGAGGVPAKIDPNGLYQVEQMYVQYFLPQNRKGKYPLLMWHGGGLTGVTYETTPDGREGWMNMFIRQGWDVYNSDAVERGRSGFAPPDVWNSEPNFLTKANPFERFRIGEGPGSWNADPAKMKVIPGNQFPVEGYDNFTKQIVPRWTNTDAAIIAAYTALVDKICPCVLLFHSQAGGFGFTVAQSRPDKIKAIVAVEPAVAGDKAKAGALKNIPTL
ncbi:MAG: esterase, partial [Pseudolabrys sp.]